MMKKISVSLITLVFAFAMIALVAIQNNHKLLGIDLQKSASENLVSNQPIEWTDSLGNRVITTEEIGKEFIGYNANIPLHIYLNEGKIIKVVPLNNEETPSFFARVVKNGLLESWNGLTPKEALEKQVVAVSGATISSDAIIKSVHKAMAYVEDNPELNYGKPNFDLKFLSVLFVILCGLILPLFTKSKVYRIVQLCLNVAVLGFWSCRFLSLSLVTGVVANKFSLGSALFSLLFLIAALVYPLCGKKDHYCLWLCPMGSIQELLGKIVPFKMKLSFRIVQILTWFRRVLWFLLMLFLWLGCGLDILNYELFTAFMITDAPWYILLAATIILLLSVVIPRPYCRFVCPTGTWVKIAINEEFKLKNNKVKGTEIK